jgi:hypothetical protein
MSWKVAFCKESQNYAASTIEDHDLLGLIDGWIEVYLNDKAAESCKTS